ncbi:YcxB-like protein [Flaviramulus basaltis]|uniref:YcxB-like protein n=1 Tax=Flaviramulus basaltis TaxID=369401 RepID=A0A1K2IQM8_9FLAO|nr:YcxB family protein [Flaviramulus basaltis]SFZ94562.1 YcxB-like protein [Flaviramulus basaltis]
MIHTKKYSLTKKDYTKIILLKRLKKSWWLYLFMFVLGILYLPKFGEDSFSTFFTIFSFSYPFVMFTYLYFWANSKDHQPIFSETHLSFDNENIYLKRNGNESKITSNSIQKVISNTKYWMLYISKGQFIYIPKNIFYSNEDYNKFSALIN